MARLAPQTAAPLSNSIPSDGGVSLTVTAAAGAGGGLTARELVVVEATARRVVELLRDRDGAASASRAGLVSASAVATELGCSRSWVYEHASELSAVRLGDGPRGRLRFDLAAVRMAAVCSASRQPEGETASAGAKTAPRAAAVRRRSPNRAPKPGAILQPRANGVKPQ